MEENTPQEVATPLTPVAAPDTQMQANEHVTMIVYALQAASLFTGGITGLAAVIINYIKQPDVQGTYLESHFRWQIGTFWISLLIGFVGFMTLIFIIGFFILGFLWFWYVYRVAKGWVYFNDKKPI